MVNLRPDLSWWDGETSVTFVGDAKYNKISGQQIRSPNADLYQMLAYTTALDLPGGLLIYAKGEADSWQRTSSGTPDKRLEVFALDLDRVRSITILKPVSQNFRLQD